MPRQTSPARGTRVAGGMSLLVAVGSAAALTGAAFFTVNAASCSEPASYLRTGGQVELTGGCVDPAELPTVQPGPSTYSPQLESGFYQT